MTIRAFLIAIPAMFLGWVLVLVAVGLLTDEAPASVVLFPSEDFLNALPVGASVLGTGLYSITLKSDAPRFAQSLYQSGAMIVLPAGLPGCLPLPKT